MTVSRLVVPGIANYTIATSAPANPTEGSLWDDTVNDQLFVYDGAAWVEFAGYGPWKAYTPTWSGTLGNGTVTGAWRRNGRSINFRAIVTWGTTTSHAAVIQTLTLPVGANAAYVGGHAIGTYTASNIATNTWSGTLILGTAPSTVYGGGSVNLSGTAAAQPTNTVPFVWASTHILTINGTYEAAS